MTLFGFCTFLILLNDGVEIDTDGHIVTNLLPSYNEMILGLGCSCINPDDCDPEVIECYNTTAVVTNIYDNKYNYKHVPIFLPYIKIINMQFPQIELDNYDLTIEDLFDIPHEYIYKSHSLSLNGNI